MRNSHNGIDSPTSSPSAPNPYSTRRFDSTTQGGKTVPTGPMHFLGTASLLVKGSLGGGGGGWLLKGLPPPKSPPSRGRSQASYGVHLDFVDSRETIALLAPLPSEVVACSISYSCTDYIVYGICSCCSPSPPESLFDFDNGRC